MLMQIQLKELHLFDIWIPQRSFSARLKLVKTSEHRRGKKAILNIILFQQAAAKGDTFRSRRTRLPSKTRLLNSKSLFGSLKQ